MIVVVEGVSASGKSTWCRKQGAHPVVPENGPVPDAPDRDKDPAAAARFWSERSASRWQAALALEQATGTAICDSDPLKLHYIWCLWQIGEAPEDHWRQEQAATRKTLCDRGIGFADAYFVHEIDPALARQRRDGDATRQRRNFALHIRLQPPLMAWYRTLGTALPGRVRFEFPQFPQIASDSGPGRHARYDVSLFDEMMAMLPQTPAF
jgi:hypothetical protein